MLSRPGALIAQILLIAPLALPAASALALESPWAKADKSEVRLISAGAAGAKAPLRAGVEIRMARGWHTYWRYPGDAGIPPRFDWSGSSNLGSAEIRWPAPQRISVEGGIESIGYTDSVLFPVIIRPADATKPVALRLKIDFGVCDKICIPASAKVAIDIPPGSGKSHALLDAAEAHVPSVGKSGNAAPAVIAAKLEPGSPLRAAIEIAVTPGKPFDLFAEGPTDDWALPLPKLVGQKDGRAHFSLPLEGAPSGTGPTPAKLRLTIVSGSEAIESLVPLD
jgi:DsbC/DsbD-like thiol-disulfide interchange protein